MSFNYKFFFHLVYISIFKAQHNDFQYTPRRILVLTLFFILYPILEIVTWFFLLLDEVLYPTYRNQEINSPVFIVGNLRSGTTFIHRLMAQDEDLFTCMKTWEIIFAPSITQRKLVWLFQDIDEKLGNPFMKLLAFVEKRTLGKAKIHKIGLDEPEEDEYLLLHTFASVVLWTFFPILEEGLKFVHFDTMMDEEEKHSAMLFYKRCIQRHLFVHGGDKQYLSKNPSFSPKIESIYKYFPDAKIIYMARNPLEVVPSMISYMSQGWQLFSGPTTDYPYTDFLVNVVKSWYQYPLEKFEETPRDKYFIVRYDDMVRFPGYTIQDIYAWFGFEISSKYAVALEDSISRAKKYRSPHSYSLEKMGYTRAGIVDRFQEIFDYFSFDTREYLDRGELQPEQDDIDSVVEYYW